MQQPWREEDCAHWLQYVELKWQGKRPMGIAERSHGGQYVPESLLGGTDRGPLAEQPLASPPPAPPSVQAAPAQSALPFQPLQRVPQQDEATLEQHRVLVEAEHAEGTQGVAGVAPVVMNGVHERSMDDAHEDRPHQAQPVQAQLGWLIAWLEDEHKDRQLKRRALFIEQGISAPPEGHGRSGQDAVDAYVAEIVFAIKEFQFREIKGGPAVGTWLQKDVVAPIFKGRWDYYSNKKCAAGFDLVSFERALTTLVSNLRIVQTQAGIP